MLSLLPHLLGLIPWLIAAVGGLFAFGFHRSAVTHKRNAEIARNQAKQANQTVKVLQKAQANQQAVETATTKQAKQEDTHEAQGKRDAFDNHW